MPAIVTAMEGLDLNRAGRDTPPTTPTSPTYDGDREAALSALRDIMEEIETSNKFCINRVRAATDAFKATTAKLQADIDETKKRKNIQSAADEASNIKIKMVRRKMDKLEKDWEQQVTDYTTTNLEEREKCTERLKFVSRVARATGIDVRAKVREAKKLLKDEGWWVEINTIFEGQPEKENNPKE